MKNIIIGTAGHIDHGKTTLIKYMTGIDTDRLPEEKEKNMTIDIGFSHFQEKNINIGIVDVPGHQKFIKNMLSGVAGINYILFIVSCDDGVMPQTIEHFEILKLLGIRNGVIVLTKKDLVTEERVEEVKKELREKFKGSFLENFEIMETSIKDIKSFERLKEKIVEDILKLEERVEEKEFLMYIDRSFSIKGYGTVVTGSVLSGELSLGENIYLYPQKEKLKVKSIERFGEKVETLESNTRGAINLSGVDYKDIKRGNFLYSNENLKPTNTIDVYFTFLDEEKIKSNQRVRVYFGTDEVLGKIRLLERYNSGWIAQIYLEKEIFVFRNQLGIMRNYAPTITLGGIKILDTQEKKINKRDVDYKERIENLKNIFENRNSLDEEKIKNEILKFLRDYHNKNNLKKGININDLKERLKYKKDDLEKVLNMMLEENLVKLDGKILSLFDFKIRLTKEEKNIKEKIFKIYKSTSISPVKYEIIKNMLISSGEKIEDIKVIHRYMVESEMIIYLDEDKYILSGYFKEIQKRLNDYFSFEENFKSGITLGKFRELIGNNRENSLSLILKLEKIGFLINKNNIRFLREKI